MTVNMRKHLWDNTSKGADLKPGQIIGTRGGSNDGTIESRTGGEALRDLDSGNRQSVKFLLMVAYEAVYTEPFLLKLDAEPAGGILCLQCVDPITNVPVACGTGVHFIWDPVNGQAQVTSIDGLSAGFQSATKRYKFTFLVVG